MGLLAKQVTAVKSSGCIGTHKTMEKVATRSTAPTPGSGSENVLQCNRTAIAVQTRIRAIHSAKRNLGLAFMHGLPDQPLQVTCRSTSATNTGNLLAWSAAGFEFNTCELSK